jgi:hypothetical protein
MKCQMLSGNCSNNATLVLHSGGKTVTYFRPTGEPIQGRAAKRSLVACNQHREQLESCRRIYGGPPIRRVDEAQT